MQNTTVQIGTITIDDLAVMIAKGFKETDQNLKELRIDLNSLEHRVENIEDNMATKDDVAVTLLNHGTRIRRIEGKLNIA